MVIPNETGGRRMQVTIPPKSARAVRLAEGDVLRVSDPEGHQVADLVAFNPADKREHLSQGFTRANNDKATVQVGDRLFSNNNAPMFTVVEDTVGVHDLLFPPCSQYLYEHVYDLPDKTGCREHLASALEEFGIGWEQVTDPFNVFMNTAIDEEGRMRIFTAPSNPGDHVDLRAEQDLIVAVSACAGDTNACNNWVCTPIEIEVLAPRSR